MTKEAVHERAKEAEHKPFKYIAQTEDVLIDGKGKVGALLEDNWFDLKADPSPLPDFQHAGVELKTTPFRKNKNNTYSAKERLVLNVINYMEEYKKTFETSSFMEKDKLMELMFYQYQPNVPKSQWYIEKSIQYTFPEKDLEIIKHDWQTIIDYIKQGKAHEISEGLTDILAACTKGASKDTMRKQPFNSELAKQRAFSIKASYMTSVLRKYVFDDKQVDSIITESNELKGESLEEIVLKRINQYIGKTQQELIILFGLDKAAKKQQRKQINAMISSRMLKLTINDPSNSEEFSKANITVKTIVVNINGKPNEAMSFPKFNFKELVNERWEESDCHNFFEETRFLFIIFEETKSGIHLMKAKFWNMPVQHMSSAVREVWEDTKNVLLSGIKLSANYNKNGKLIVNNNFIGEKHNSRLKGIYINNKLNSVIHVRPHSSNATYIFNNSNGNELPVPAIWKNKPEEFSDLWMTNSCFWLNRSYIQSEIVNTQ